MSAATFRLRPLSDLFEVDKAQICKDETDYSKLQFIGLENIESHTKRYLPEFVSKPEGVCHRFSKDHILYGKLRPYLNKVYLPEFDGKCSTEIVPLLPKNGYSREFISTILQSRTFIEEAVKHSTGGRMPRANLKHLLKLKVSVPEAEEANIVANSLQLQLAHVETMRQAALKQKEAAKVLQSAVLWGMFPWQAGEALPAGWRWEKLGKICKIYAGATPSRTNPYYWGGDIPWIKTGEINFNRISETEEFITEAGLNNSSARWIPKGAILIALYGQGATRGKVAILDIEATSNQACCALVCPDSLLNIYLFYFLYSRYEDIRNLSSGSSQDNLNGGLIKDYSIPIPSTKAEQEKIAKLVEDKLQSFKKLGEKFDNQLKAIKALPATILREAFAFQTSEV